MNILNATALSFESEESIIKLKLCIETTNFSVLMLDIASLAGLQFPSKVELLFKEEELMFADLNSQVSVENNFIAKVIKLKKGKILWQVSFDFKGQILNAIISATKGKEMELCENDEKLCFVKPSDIVLRVLHAR